MNDVTKLPKWAQVHIEMLESKLRLVKNQLETSLLNNARNGSGVVSLRNGTDKSIVLNDYATIEFKLKDSTKIRVSFRNEANDCYVDVNGDSPIAIYPRGANYFHIR